MQQNTSTVNTATTTTSSAKSSTTEHAIQSAPHSTAVTASSVAAQAVNSLSAAAIKGEQFSTSAASTTAQVITVVAPTHNTTSHGNNLIAGQPVVVQVSSGGQFIAVAVSPESAGQTSGGQQSDSAAVASGAATASTDEDDGQSGFEDFATAAYTNGANSGSAMTYYTTDSYTTATAYYNTGGVNQILTDGTYLVMEQTDPTLTGGSGAQRTSPQTDKQQQSLPAHGRLQSNTSTTGALLINPFTLQTDPHNTSNTTANTTHINTASLQQQHQNVRDMDIVHVQWLIENYETAEGVSLPRSTLYSHYQQHCQQHNIEPVNAASFGKLIRSVFIGLRTRRLGTRGNSKYHYYGIRVKPGSSLARLSDIGTASGILSGSESSPTPPTKRAKTSNSISTGGSKVVVNAAAGDNSHQTPVTSATPEVLLSYLGDSSLILPTVWPEVPDNLNVNETQKLFSKFTSLYRSHYDEIITALGNLQFNSVEVIWQQFWQRPDNCDNKDDVMTISQLQGLTTSGDESSESTIPAIADWIIQTDYTMYNAIISSLLLPNLLRPIPQNLTQQIRNFAKNINQWMTNALVGYDDEFVLLKVAAVGAFSHTLRRYTSLNHLSSAARAVLQNQQQIQQMINDLNRVDFKNVQVID
ncbi:unnamed protein product [Medioppia subpectinata]|uniref:RFX-type winged-helix domain-containing protein n=1 Tax=Medioppia subpectinata TaxID=1979941 RepID=A0A7R9KVS7_9ACAR|nr:unnamed protein product [Medioppia subpectinata]CAG2110385.1 unnamed protein product [Medioppia subpectinata]